MNAEIERRSGGLTLIINDGHQVLLNLLESAVGKHMKIVDEAGVAVGTLVFRVPLKESPAKSGTSTKPNRCCGQKPVRTG